MTNLDSSHSKAVLVVDDDGATLTEMTEALRDHGLKVHAAQSGEKALVLAARHRPSFVLMDFDLPGRNGVDTITKMRRFMPLTIFIMMSGMDDFCRDATTKNTGTFAVLKKPVPIDSIARFIRNRFETAPSRTLDVTSMLTG